MKHLCILPFIHLANKPKGSVRYCCFSPNNFNLKSESEPYNLGKDPIEEIWDSEHATNMRNRMLSGEKISQCKICWNEEDAGKVSKRMYENKKYLDRYKNRLEFAKNNKGKLKHHLPIYLDIRPGNLCNLKCRSCNPELSSKIENEVQNKWDHNASKENFSYYIESVGSDNSWYKSTQYLETINAMLPTMDQIYISGGEPLINKSILDLLDRCVSEGSSKNIFLRLNTNLTVMNKKLLDTFSQFKRVSIGASIDAYGDKLNYLRNPLNWSALEKNLHMLLDNKPKNLDVEMNCTVTLMNALYIDELFNYIHKLRSEKDIEIEIITDIAHEPDFLNITLLPKNIKTQVNHRINNLIESTTLLESEIADLKSLVRYMNCDNEDSAENINNFKFYTLQLDRIRNESFATTFPELKEILEI